MQYHVPVIRMMCLYLLRKWWPTS